MRHCLAIVCGLFLSCALCWGEQPKKIVKCGHWIEIAAIPYEGYYFVQWSDGDTTAVRQIQVNDNLDLIAYFGTKCKDYANLPMLELYDWLLMLDVRTIHDMGLHFGEENVTWYRVVGTPDEMDDTFPLDDEVVCTGYYLTIDRNLWTTGDYYAVVDVSATPSGELCALLMRTQIAHFAGTKPNQRLLLTPSYVLPGEQMQIIGLSKREVSTISVYDMVGRLLLTTTSQNETSCLLQAANCPGCYNIVVRWGDKHQTLRYLVRNP